MAQEIIGAPEKTWGAEVEEEAPPVTGRKLMAIMVSVLLGILLAALDQTIVGPALPKIIGELNGFDQYAWVVTMYMLTSTITVPIFGKLSDMYGRKWFFIGGIVVFLIGSALSGLSWDIYSLIAFRGVQGLGAGILFASAFAIIADLIPPRDRGKWQGAFGAVWGLASVIGPTVGGFLTDFQSWRWVFYVNVPVGLVALVVLVAIFPADRKHGAKKQIDWLGAATLVAGLTPLLLALSFGGTEGWAWDSPQVLGLFAAAVVLLGLFIAVEWRAPEAIIPMDLFKNSIFVVSTITVFVSGMGLFGAVLFIPLFIQAVQGDSATNSGNAVTPMMIAVVIGSVVSGQITSRTGKYRLLGIAGMGLVTLGAFLLSTMNMDTPRFTTIAYMVIMGLGMGTTFPLYTLIVQNAFPMNRVGVVTAAVQFFRSIGSTVGVALLGSLVNGRFQSQLPSELQAQVNTLPPEVQRLVPVDRLASGLSNVDPQALVSAQGIARLKAELVQSGTPAAFVDQVVTLITEAMKPALFSGIQQAFLIGALLLAVGLVATAFIKELPLRKSNAGPRQQQSQEAVPAGSNGHGEMGSGNGWEPQAEKAGKELIAGGAPAPAAIPAADEPRLIRK